VSGADKSVPTAYRAYGEKQDYGRTVTGVVRSTFVIDEKGRIERAMYNVKATGHVAKGAPRAGDWPRIGLPAVGEAGGPPPATHRHAAR